MQPGEELVREPCRRLIEKQKLLSYKYSGFWQCMDTFKDKQRLEDLNQGIAPWKVWQQTIDNTEDALALSTGTG